jgi:hypothetical protein
LLLSLGPDQWNRIFWTYSLVSLAAMQKTRAPGHPVTAPRDPGNHPDGARRTAGLPKDRVSQILAKGFQDVAERTDKGE